jgi:hypothetical protein
VSKAFGVNETLTEAIFKSSSTIEEAVGFAKAYGKTGSRLTYQANNSEFAKLIYNGEEIPVPAIPLPANTMLLSNGLFYKMMASMEIQANPTKSLKELKPGIDKRANDFLQGVVNKAKDQAQQARTFNPATIVKLNPNEFNSFQVYTLGGDVNKQTAGDVAVLRKLNKQFKASGLGNTGLRVTSVFRANATGKTYHNKKDHFAIDVQSTNSNPKVLGMQLYELFVTQASISNGKPYQILGHVGGQRGKLFEIALQIKNTRDIPSEYVGTMSADKARFMVKHVNGAQKVFDEGSKADPHLHLSGGFEQVNSSKAYNNR